jgi:hypothetical protein
VIGDAVEYAVHSGLNAKDVNSFFNVFTTVLTSIIQNGNTCSLENSARVLKDCLLSGPAPISCTMSHHAASYVTRTLLQHFRLYHYLLNHRQQESHTEVQMPVETPDKCLPPLKDGMVESEWENKEKIRKIEERHALNETLLRNERQEYVEKENSAMAKMEEEIFMTLQSKISSGIKESEIRDMTASLVEARTRQFLGSMGYEMSQQEGAVGMRAESLTVGRAQPQAAGSSPPSSKRGKQSPNAKSPASGGTPGRKT